MMHQLSCDNGNESSHEAEEEERPVSASSTTLDTPSGSSADGTESHQPPTRHRRDADDVSQLLLQTLRSTSTVAEETDSSSGIGTTGTYVVTSTTRMVETVTTNNDTPEDMGITTQEFTAPVVVSAADGLTLTGNHEQQLYTTTDPSTMAATKMVPTEYFVTAVPNNTYVTVKEMMQKMTVDYPHQDQSIQKTETIGDVSPTLVTTSSTGLSSVSTAVITSESLGIINEVKEITISFAEDNITRNNTEEIEMEMKMKDEILLPETFTVMMGTNAVNDTMNTTASNSNNESISTSDEERVKQNGKVSPEKTKQNAEIDHQTLQEFVEEYNRLQFLPAPLRDLPHDIDNHINKIGTLLTSDLAAPSNKQDEDEQIQPAATEIEVLARPNRGRRLTRPQSHSFYPYFLKRVLG
jgi:hypothetical protein